MATRTLKTTEARKGFLKIMREFARGMDREYVITHKGKDVAAILGYKEYKKLMDKLDEIEERIELGDEEYVESIKKARKEKSRSLDAIIKELTKVESKSS